jgi:hypothetical protein
VNPPSSWENILMPKLKKYNVPVLLSLTALAALALECRAATLTIEVFDPPNSTRTVGVGINAGGNITGFFDDAKTNKTRGFVRFDNGDITVFDVPGSGVTAPAAINTGGKITGGYRPLNGSKFMAFIRDARGNFTTFDSPDGVLAPSSINDLGVVAGVFYYKDNVITEHNDGATCGLHLGA